MYPDLYLYVEQVRARELREEADQQRRARTVTPTPETFEERLGWALVRTGLRLVSRHRAPQWSPSAPPR